MKKLLFLLFFLPVTVFTQNSWVKVEMQPDQYAGETSWEIYNADGDTVAVSPVYTSNVYQEDIIPLDAGFYNLVVHDSFGDGICCDFGSGWFGVSNDCGLSNYVYDFNSVQAVVAFTLDECLCL